ncbi:hypothetical protein ACE14D_18480 [Streptomyces sp. Act-28]
MPGRYPLRSSARLALRPGTASPAEAPEVRNGGVPAGTVARNGVAASVRAGAGAGQALLHI